jgi:hypothetical protein
MARLRRQARTWGPLPMRIGEVSSAKVISDRAVADDQTWPLRDRLDGQVVAPCSGQVDFPPLAGHRGYAARVDGSGWT